MRACKHRFGGLSRSTCLRQLMTARFAVGSCVCVHVSPPTPIALSYAHTWNIQFTLKKHDEKTCSRKLRTKSTYARTPPAAPRRLCVVCEGCTGRKPRVMTERYLLSATGPADPVDPGPIHLDTPTAAHLRPRFLVLRSSYLVPLDVDHRP